MTSLVVAVLLAGGGAWAAVHGARLVVRAVRRADDEASSLWIVRGIRGVVVAIAAWALAGGLLFAQNWLLVFGGIFLAEELYETGVVVLVLRRSSPAQRAPLVGRPPNALNRSIAVARRPPGPPAGSKRNRSPSRSGGPAIWPWIM